MPQVMECFRVALVMIVLICVVPRPSDGSSTDNSLFLTETGRKTEGVNQMSPSPSPGPEGKWDSGKAQSPIVNGTKEENCDNVLHSCVITEYNITACVVSVENGSEEAYLFIQINNSNFQTSNATVQLRPANITLPDKTIPLGNLHKVILNSTLEEISSLKLSIGINSCEIQIGAALPQGFYNYITPKYGAYLLFVAAIFAGGTWACCKLVKRKRHLAGVPYQELEMGQLDTDPSFVIESPEGWDENWDDDWDEEKAVRSPGARKGLQNGASLKYIDTSQWGNDWDE